MKRKPELDNKDHKFAAYLRAHGWNGVWNSEEGTNEFLNGAGETIAYTVYHNLDCTYRVWID